MSFLKRIFQPKHLRLEVTEGLDRDNHLWLTGDRLVVGTAENAHLRLSASGISANHVVLMPDKDAGGSKFFSSEERWRYKLEGDSFDSLDGAKAPRSGQIAIGQVLRVAGSTDLRIVNAEVDENAPEDIITKVKNLSFFPIKEYWAYASVFYAAILIFLVLAFVGWNTRSAQDADGPRRLQVMEWSFNAYQTRDVAQSELAEDFAGCEVPGVDPTALQATAYDLVLRAQLLISGGRPDLAADELRAFEARMGDASCAARAELRCDIAQLSGRQITATCGRGN